MKIVYHVSLKRNLKSIMKYGLIPKIGTRSKELKEEKAVFLFTTREDMETALGQWLGNWFSEKTVLMSLEITLPDEFPIIDSTVDYEKVSKIRIPPVCIRFIQDE